MKEVVQTCICGKCEKPKIIRIPVNDLNEPEKKMKAYPKGATYSAGYLARHDPEEFDRITKEHSEDNN